MLNPALVKPNQWAIVEGKTTHRIPRHGFARKDPILPVSFSLQSPVYQRDAGLWPVFSAGQG